LWRAGKDGANGALGMSWHACMLLLLLLLLLLLRACLDEPTS
jgi:hypothetical protein